MRKEALIDRCFRAVMKCSGVGLGNACPRGDAQTASRTADRCGPKAGTVGLKGRREERDEGENRKNLCDTMGSASSAGSSADEAETICFILEGGSRKKLPLGVSLWGKSVYTSSCDERGLTLKGSPRSRGATAFSPLVAASKKSIVGQSLLPTMRLQVSSPPDKKQWRKRLLHAARLVPWSLCKYESLGQAGVRELRTGPLKLRGWKGNGLLVVRQTVCFLKKRPGTAPHVSGRFCISDKMMKKGPHACAQPL